MNARAPFAAVGFLATIILANYLTTTYGFVPVGWGYSATAGTYAAGLAFVLRDAVQDTAGRRAVLLLVAGGGVLSALVAAPAIALASGVAFALSELADYAVYTPLRRHGYVRAAVASNLVGAVVDSIVFLTIAGFPVWSSLPGQIIGKTGVTAVVVLLVLLVRATRDLLRDPVE